MSELLKLVARTPPGKPCRETSAVQWNRVDDRHFRYVLAAGLGPLLFHATQDTIEQAPAPWRDALQSADLTARVTHGNLCDATGEILDACNADGVPVTLLKGISIAEELYPAGHLRPMGDIDLLVPEQECGRVEEMLLAHGYVRKSGYQADDGEPHRAPLFHPERDVWVEVHTALFPRDDRLLQDSLFSASQIGSQEVASTFHGRPTYRLSREMQLAYVSSYWIRDLSRNPFHPSFVTPMIDAIYLVKAPGKTLDWEALLAWLDNETAIASVYLMLSSLAACGLDRSLMPALSRFASRQRIIAAAERRILTSMIDVNLIQGRPFLGQFGVRHPMIARSIFCSMLLPGSHLGKLLTLPLNVVFPPWIAERYTLRYQGDRIRRFLQR